MRYIVTVENIKVPIGATDSEIVAGAEKVLRKCGVLSVVSDLHVRKKSVDARHKDSIVLVCSVAGAAELDGDRVPAVKGVKFTPETRDEPVIGEVPMPHRPVIVGFGPAGMFCALELARHGYAPIVFERGGNVESRIRAVDRFMGGGEFSDATNVQFGAGGAGTFSDGKLTTRIGDPLCRGVLETFCSFGAPGEIMWQAKPHIGTDILRRIVDAADREITRLGGDVRYDSLVTDVDREFVTVSEEKVPFGALVLAIGHSARDTYKRLFEGGFDMTPKPFSVGVRIEHLREDIDCALYGDAAALLPPAEYALSHRVGERGVYTFCMCPGGVVVPAASEEGGVVVNGMSYHARDGRNSNCAIAVSVLPEDLGGGVMGGVEYQRHLERSAFRLGGGDWTAPAQSVGNFLHGAENRQGRVSPTYMDGRVRMCDVGGLFSRNISDMLRLGITKFGRQIRGFDCDDAILTGVETRTSAPLRILRGEDRRAPGMGEIYPCGEGAGYAGGIMSAAVDGIRTARAIMAKFAPPEM